MVVYYRKDMSGEQAFNVDAAAHHRCGLVLDFFGGHYLVNQK